VSSLACYLIRENIEGRPVEQFDDVIDPENQGSNLRRYGPFEGSGFEAALFVTQGPPREPMWTPFLREGFPDLTLPRTPAVGAVLVVRVPREKGERYLAFTFGSGRFLLRSDAWEHSFGMRTALNVIFEGDDGSIDASRLRVVDARRVEANTLHTRRQSNRRAPFETFDVDLRRDLLHAVDGRPVDPDHWGERIGGSDPLHLNLEVTLPALGDLCRRILDAHTRTDYRVRFSWVDNIRVVTNEDELAALDQQLVSDLRDRRVGDYDLAFPEIIDWPRVARFQFDFDRRKTPVLRPEPRLHDLLTGLSAAEKLDDLDIPRLKRLHLWAVDADGNMAYRWPIWRCLTGQVTVGGVQYLLDGGAFYEVAPDYLSYINGFLDGLEEWTGDLPDCEMGMTEPTYNEFAAHSSPNLLLLDRQFVRAPERTSPIEVCDLLSSDGALIHVKKGWGAADLSHLFAQGAVSAELLLTLTEFRAAALEVIDQAESKRAAEAKEGTALGEFKLFREDGLSPADHPVVYAVVGPWDSAGLAERLPFFSKVNLLRSIERLEGFGFSASYKRIGLALPA
jgi:uncharacterized protein (TIGR04141 family)